MTEFDRAMREEIAEGERWLASFPTPEPSPANIERIKRTARAARSAHPPLPSADRWTVWHGILAAAASIALAVTIGWHSARQHPNSGTGEFVTEAESSWFADAGQDALALTDLDEGLSSLESWSANEPWNVNGVKLYETLDGVLNDAVEDDSGDTGSSMRQPDAFVEREEV